MSDPDSPAPGRIKRLWQWLWHIPKAWYWLGIPLGAVLAFVVGILFWGGFAWGVELSSTLGFCTSCHEMRDNVYQEYKKTIHYQNPAGVRAICSDCHVPKVWGPKLMRKMQASVNELPKHFLGFIDTPAKFQAHRREMAEDVWRTMRATDSRECRNCHSYEAMAFDQQSRQAWKKHERSQEPGSGKTCIDCHQGIAHKLPDAETEKTETPES